MPTTAITTEAKTTRPRPRGSVYRPPVPAGRIVADVISALLCQDHQTVVRGPFPAAFAWPQYLPGPRGLSFTITAGKTARQGRRSQGLEPVGGHARRWLA